MRVLITGGTGLIGRVLAPQLVAAGHDVVVSSRRPGAKEDVPERVSAFAWDTVGVEGLLPVLESVDAVIHLSGENIGSRRWTAGQKRRILESRVRSTQSLVQAFGVCSNRPAVFIQGSAVGYYGPRGDEEIRETAPPGDDYLAHVCRDWEAASATLERLGVRRVIARTGVVFATNGGALPRILQPFKFFVGGPVGSGLQVLPWIHIEDEARALLHLLEDDGAEGAFNLTAPGAVSNRQLARVVGRLLQRPSFVPAPAFALRLLLGEMATLVLDGQRAVPARLLESGFEFSFPEVEPALRELLVSGAVRLSSHRER